jgi:tetratricopeptide (TPR) repeat protein
MWEAYQKVLGTIDDKTISTGSRLAWMYLRHERIDESLEVDRTIWMQCKDHIGPTDPRTMRAADSLAKSLALCGPSAYGMFEASLGVYEEVWNAVQKDEFISEDDFITAAFNYTHALETCGLAEVAEQKLVALISELRLQDLHVDVLRGRLQVTIELSKTRQRRGRLEDARETLVKAWETFKSYLDDNRGDRDVLVPPFRAMALALRNLGDFTRSSEIYARILELQRSILGPNDLKVIAASFHLAGVHRISKDRKAEEAVLRLTFEDAFIRDPKGSGTLRAGSNLAMFYQGSDRWQDAGNT